VRTTLIFPDLDLCACRPYSPVSSLPYDENLSAVASTVPVNAVEKAVEGRLQHNEFDDEHNQSAATLSAAKPFPLSHHLD